MDGKEGKIHKLVADVLVRAQGRVLLVRYDDVRKYDGQEGWAIDVIEEILKPVHYAGE